MSLSVVPPNKSFSGPIKTARILRAQMRAAFAVRSTQTLGVTASRFADVRTESNKKVLRTLPQSADDADVSDTALGDWYVNRIIVDRQPLLLLVSPNSLLAVLTHARDVKTLPSRVSELLANRLRRMGIDEDLIRAEVQAMGIAVVGRTRDRSVTGQMVDFAKAVPYYIPMGELDGSTLGTPKIGWEGLLADAVDPMRKPFGPPEMQRGCWLSVGQQPRRSIEVTLNHCMQPTPQPVIKFACANLSPAWRAADAGC